MAKNTTASFENTLSELEDIVNTLETGDVSLQDAMEKFEKGVALSNQCQQALSDAEAKVQILIDNNLKDFDEQP